MSETTILAVSFSWGWAIALIVGGIILMCSGADSKKGGVGRICFGFLMGGGAVLWLAVAILAIPYNWLFGEEAAAVDTKVELVEGKVNPPERKYSVKRERPLPVPDPVKLAREHRDDTGVNAFLLGRHLNEYWRKGVALEETEPLRDAINDFYFRAGCNRQDDWALCLTGAHYSKLGVRYYELVPDKVDGNALINQYLLRSMECQAKAKAVLELVIERDVNHRAVAAAQQILEHAENEMFSVRYELKEIVMFKNLLDLNLERQEDWVRGVYFNDPRYVVTRCFSGRCSLPNYR